MKFKQKTNILCSVFLWCFQSFHTNSTLRRALGALRSGWIEWILKAEK